jgi:hypothetical protein
MTVLGGGLVSLQCALPTFLSTRPSHLLLVFSRFLEVPYSLYLCKLTYFQLMFLPVLMMLTLM